MVKWQVKAIQVGSIHANMSGLMHYIGEQKPVEVPIWVVAATDGQHKVLIDTGIDDLASVVAGPEPNCCQKPEEQTLTALKNAMGWEPEDVDLVINTHLHFDHCGCNKYFPNAKICVQRREWEFAHHPISSTSFLYYRPFFDRTAVSYFQWKFVEGETELYPGMIVIPTPGHTAGHQSVLINTEEGVLCVAGDIVSVVENINCNIEANIVVNAQDVYMSFERIRERAHYILPGHEFRVKDGTQSGFPVVE